MENLRFEIPAKYRYVPFLELLANAAFQHNQTTLTEKPFEVSMYARASIMASALSVECAANCLLSSLSLTKTLQHELDKMPALSKFEACLQLKGITGFDRGIIEVSRITELVKARNDFVHPKITNVAGAMTTPEDGGTEWIFPFTLNGDHHPQLTIPKISLFWSASDSLRVLDAIAVFYRYIFFDLLKLNREELQDLLIPRFEAASVYMPAVPDEVKDALASVKDKGVDFSFLALFDLET